jgi:hypothetical protein
MKFSRVLVAVIVAAFVGAAIYVGCFITIGVPNYVGPWQEQIAISKLKQGANKDTMVSFLKQTHAGWKPGAGWQGCGSRSDCGLSYPNFYVGEPCESGWTCTHLIQVAFSRYDSICMTHGDVITMAFRDDGRLQYWRVEPAAGGGC